LEYRGFEVDGVLEQVVRVLEAPAEVTAAYLQRLKWTALSWMNTGASGCDASGSPFKKMRNVLRDSTLTAAIVDRSSYRVSWRTGYCWKIESSAGGGTTKAKSQYAFISWSGASRSYTREFKERSYRVPRACQDARR
jgi:hypothetical protein